VEWSGEHSTPAGNRGKDETPQAKTRRLSFLPAESARTSAQWNELILKPYSIYIPKLHCFKV